MPLHLTKLSGYALAALIAASGVNAHAQDQSARRVMIGAGIQTKPVFPGSGDNRLAFMPVLETWHEGEPMPVETPDESISIAVIGRRGAIAAGPSLSFAPQRAADELPGYSPVKFGVELGGFVEVYPIAPLRLRAELRQGIGAHRGLTGDLAADLVLRNGTEGVVATLGPRLRWGSAKYNRAYFGTGNPAPAGIIMPYEPGAGVYALGAVAGLHLPIDGSWGIFSYVGYDRLTGPAARSPIVKAGSKNQYSAGLALTYRFSL